MATVFQPNFLSVARKAGLEFYYLQFSISNHSSFLLILFIFSDCSEEIRIADIVSVGKRSLSTVADDEGPIVG